MKPIISTGTGLAGYTVAREYRRLDPRRPLLLISCDDGALYSRPMLSAVGLKPDLQLAQATGLKCHRGIVCDPFLRASDPHSTR